MRTIRTGFTGLAAGLVVTASLGAGSGPPGDAPPQPADSGPMRLGPSGPLDAMTDERRAEIEAMLDANVTRLRSAGKLRAAVGAPVQLTFPLEPAAGLDIPEPWGIYGFVDQDLAFPDRILDYNCGPRTYDRVNGYNHAGTDFGIWPWRWKLLDEGSVSITAAAPGTIIGKQDGYPDRSCDWNGSPYWNAVYVLHDDGSVAWYGHMKTYSTTGKAVGERIERGEYLGRVGSSGTSNTPHLHFELHDASGHVTDPYFGPCSRLSTASWWLSQGPYVDSKVLHMTTGALGPIMPPCPNIETPNEQKDFAPGQVVDFTIYLRDVVNGQTIVHDVFNPDGSLNRSWSAVFSAASLYPLAWWVWPVSFPAESPTGTYTWRVSTAGKRYSYRFNVGVAPAGRVAEQWAQGTPLTVGKTTGAADGVVLDWGTSCRASDSDFSIYEGLLQGRFDDYAARVCSTGGRRSWTLAPAPAASVYWLVVPRNGTRGGSYGTDGDGEERPEPQDRCVRQQFECDWWPDAIRPPTGP